MHTGYLQEAATEASGKQRGVNQAARKPLSVMLYEEAMELLHGYYLELLPVPVSPPPRTDSAPRDAVQ